MNRPYTRALIGGMLLASIGLTGGAFADSLPITELKTAIARQPSGAEAQAFVDRVHRLYNAKSLSEGVGPIVKDLTVGWMIEVHDPAKAPRVNSQDGQLHETLERIGTTDLYAEVMTLPNKAGVNYTYDVDGKSLRSGGLEVYLTPDDDKVQPGVPQGKLTEHLKWPSKIFNGTTRDWWVYTPAQYTPGKPACVMIFQDGEWAKNYAPPVFDNLINRGDIPVTVVVFITPGDFGGGHSNRSFEYDTLSDQYSRFLLEEILPEVEKTTNLRHDAASRAVAGISSGGICAWTVAWERPDQFSKVLSWVGSFTDLAAGPNGISGGHNYPFMIRRSNPKPIRIFMQDGENDVDNEFGSWSLCAQQMAKALAFKGYDYKFEFGHGFHSDNHGRAIMPDSLRWLWRGYKP